MKLYESLETTPDDLVLFLHHLPYDHKLRSGKTVIQFIYDSHYDGPTRWPDGCATGAPRVGSTPTATPRS